MRPLLIFILLSLSCTIKAQTDSSKIAIDTTPKQVVVAPYLKNPTIPTFSIQLQDSSWFFKTNLSDRKPVLILYFSPDCGHCQLETEEIMSKVKLLNDLQIIMITSRPFEDMLKFIQHYKLDKFPTITVGKDHARLITRFYDIRLTPFSALYSKKGKLVKVYPKGIDMSELIKLVN